MIRIIALTLFKMRNQLFISLLGITRSFAAVTYRQPAHLQPLLLDSLNNSNAVPGRSPFVYMRDSTNDLLAIQSLDMFPATPSIPSTVEFFLAGIFKEDLSSIDMAFNIIDYLKDGTSGSFQGIDDLCNGWVRMEQAGRAQCPPKKGQATISKSIELPRGWVEEVS